MELLGYMTYDLPFTPLYLFNEVYINKIELFPSIFVLGSLEVSCEIILETRLCELWFTNLILHSDLYAIMLGQLEVKIRNVLELDTMTLGRLRGKILNVSYFH